MNIPLRFHASNASLKSCSSGVPRSKEKFTTQPWAAKLRDGPGLMALGAQTAWSPSLFEGKAWLARLVFQAQLSVHVKVVVKPELKLFVVFGRAVGLKSKVFDAFSSMNCVAFQVACIYIYKLMYTHTHSNSVDLVRLITWRCAAYPALMTDAPPFSFFFGFDRLSFLRPWTLACCQKLSGEEVEELAGSADMRLLS